MPRTSEPTRRTHHDATGAQTQPLKVQLHPVRDADLPEVARFLGTHMPPDLPVDQWAEAWRRSINLPDSVDAPNHGFLLRYDHHIVGVYLAMYSKRTIDGRPELFCSLGQWCVAPDFRRHSLRLARALLAQEGYHFTDVSPSDGVQRLNRRLGFQLLDTTAALVPNLPWPTLPGRTVVSSDPALIAATLTGEDLRHYRNHAACGWARHLVLINNGQHCHVIVRRERRFKVPLFASILYASNPGLLRRAFRPLARHLLLRHGALATLVEIRVAGGRLRPSLLRPQHRPKMFRSASLRPEKIDYLYSELTCAP